jgi:hypothetical protein
MPLANRCVQLCWWEEIGKRPKRARERGPTRRKRANPVLLFSLFFFVVFLWIPQTKNLTAGMTCQDAVRSLGLE